MNWGAEGDGSMSHSCVSAMGMTKAELHGGEVLKHGDEGSIGTRALGVLKEGGVNNGSARDGRPTVLFDATPFAQRCRNLDILSL